MMSRGTRPRVVLALVALLLGLWIALVPFDRPLPGGSTFSLEATPAIDCRSPAVGMLGHDRPTAEVYTSPRPADGDPMEVRTVDCTGRARFRVGLGGLLAVLGLLGLVIRRSPRATPRP